MSAWIVKFICIGEKSLITTCLKDHCKKNVYISVDKSLFINNWLPTIGISPKDWVSVRLLHSGPFLINKWFAWYFIGAQTCRNRFPMFLTVSEAFWVLVSVLSVCFDLCLVRTDADLDPCLIFASPEPSIIPRFKNVIVRLLNQSYCWCKAVIFNTSVRSVEQRKWMIYGTWMIFG